MNLSLKIKALKKLRESNSEAAKAAIEKEYANAVDLIKNSTEYQLLHDYLEILNIVGYIKPSETLSFLASFIEIILTRSLTYPDLDDVLASRLSKYRNASSLAVQAIQIITDFRYQDIKFVLKLFLNLSVSSDKNINTQARQGLKLIASYNEIVIYGEGDQGGFGLAVQYEILKVLNELNNDELENKFVQILEILDQLISSVIETTKWVSYESLSISRGSVHSIPQFSKLHYESISFLISMYNHCKNSRDKIKVVSSLSNAARNFTNAPPDEFLSEILNRDTVQVLDFYRTLTQDRDLSVVQKVERNGYWIFHNTNSETIKQAALLLETAISKNSEYQIFKILIGFEGIFESWDVKSKHTTDFDEEEFRNKKTVELASEINESNIEIWGSRILLYTQTQSNDLATFPKFYEFLFAFAKLRPDLAFEFVSLNNDAIKDFLVPFFRSLWSSSAKGKLLVLFHNWIRTGEHICPISRAFIENNEFDIDLLRQVLDKASELDDLPTLCNLISISVSNQNCSLENKVDLTSLIFVPALKKMSNLKSASWIFDFWYRQDATKFIKSLDLDAINLILDNMKNLNEIDYQAEEILSLISEEYPENVIYFLCGRLHSQSENIEHFEALPFELYRLNAPLAKHPKLLLDEVYKLYIEDSLLFQFKGARLVRIVFKELDEYMEDCLIDFIKSKDELKIHFVLSILRTYQGQTYLHKVIREVIISLPLDHELLTEAMIALESTGVISGEYGFSMAYKRKKDEILYWLDDSDSKVKDFATNYINTLDNKIIQEEARATEQITLRKHKFD